MAKASRLPNNVDSAGKTTKILILLKRIGPVKKI